MDIKTDNNNAIGGEGPTFFSRVLANDTLRKGVAGALAGVLVAVVSETLWPSER